MIVHFPEAVPSVLPHILGRAGPLEAMHSRDGDRIRNGRIYVAPPDFHLLVERETSPCKLSAFSCPECRGPLYEIEDGGLLRFRCRMGHACTADGVLDENTEALEGALYMALNTLEESATMADRLAARSRGHDHPYAAARFEERAKDARQRAAMIHRVLTEGTPDATTGTA